MFKKLSFRATSLIVALVLALGSAVAVFAAGTPAWWDNPGGYTTWSQIIDSGTITNNQISQIGATVYTDIPISCSGGATSVDTWVQIEWTVTAGTATFLNNPFDRVVERTSASCPASSADTFPSTNYNFAFLTDNGTFTPEWLANGQERSYTDSGSPLPGCERIQTKWNVNPGSSLDYRIEVQKVCMSPTAITLEGMSAASGTPYLPLALAGAAFVLVAGAGLVLRKRYMA